MEQYMSKTREDSRSGVTRPAINQDTQFELKGQFLKELHDNTFSGLEQEDANEHIEKVLEIVDFFHIPKITQDQIMLRASHVSLTGAASKWLRNQPSGLITTWEEPDEILFRTWEGFKELRMKYSNGAIPLETDADAKVAIQEMTFSYKPNSTISDNINKYRVAGLGFYQRNNRNSSYPEWRPSLEESLTKFMVELAKRHEEKSNIIKEIRASIDAAIRNQCASIKTLEIQIGYMSKVLQERGFGSLPSSTETNPRDQVKSISTAKADFSKIHRIGYGPVAKFPLNNLGVPIGCNMARDVVLSDEQDSWQWSLDVSVGFSVSSVCSLINAHILDVSSTATRWNPCIPIKVNVFLWRLLLEAPSRMAKELWALMARWWELDIPFCANISEWFDWLDSLQSLE
uniref:RNA-directed DNA polymerase, eukaryota, reverse transcriptase zinc-binding domain protein n=1 Tax=Tanacetum cinerariifolium TaxID=118510 RepID=A0A6L2JR83_TANCI|nr:RNA-directed DNA polymerase, eukaryota, reverse transcriptase zinc-binding domain protein [Tanacetum cinerariifolium]